MPVVGLADGLVEGLVLDVKEASPMERARRDDCGVPASDKLREKVVGLLAVDDTGKRAVLPLEEHPSVHQDADEKARLTLSKTEGRKSGHPCWASAITQVAQAQRAHRNFSAIRGSNERPPLRPPPP